MDYLDNLKVLLTVLVILHHVGQAYGPTGGFWTIRDADSFAPLGYFFLFNASFFMGLFFFISGYFFRASCARKGPGAFANDRLLRLGVPVLFALLVMMPVLGFVFQRTHGYPDGFLTFYRQGYLGIGGKPAAWTGRWPDLNFGHAWFIENLLVYSLLFALWWRLRTVRGPVPAPEPASRFPSAGWIVLYIFLLGTATWLVRVVLGWPMDRWTGFLGFIQMEPAHLPQYASLLVLGIIAGSRRWLDRLDARTVRPWFILAGVFLVYLICAACIPALALWFMWEWKEALLCVSVGLALLGVFRFMAAGSSSFSRWAAANSYAAYFFHFPIIIAIQFAIAPWTGPAWAKFLLVSASGVPLTYGLSALVRQPRWLRRVF